MTEHMCEFVVRDYELDLQGIVNNANYQHYLEHARHECLCSLDVDFSRLHDEGKDMVVTRIEIDYKSPLKSRDKFKVISSMRKDGYVRIVFDQKIIRVPDGQPIVNAKVTGVCLFNGRPVKSEGILPDSLFQ